MSPSLNQIEQLKKELASGQVVVVVGSGVSVAACGQQLVEVHKVATWSGLLEHGVDRLSAIGAADGVVEMLHSMIRSGNTDFMINAAEIITDRFKTRSQGTFRGWLEETIGVLQLQDADLLRDIANLPGLVATLNEDIAATLKIFKECAQFDENWIVYAGAQLEYCLSSLMAIQTFWQSSKSERNLIRIKVYVCYRCRCWKSTGRMI
jgi:hypothetical protein